MLTARGVGGCHFSFYQVPCLRLTQCCLSCCTIIGGGHTVKIACENNHGCQGSMTLLCPDSSWQRSGRVDKISTTRREFLKDCSHTATLQNKEKGETGDNGRLVSARICWSFPWGSSSSLSPVFHWESSHFTLCILPPLKHADVPGADPNHPLACQHSLCANWQQQKQNPLRRRQDLYLLCSEWMAKEGLGSAQGCSKYNCTTENKCRNKGKGKTEGEGKKRNCLI